VPAAVAILCANIRRVRLARGWSQEASAEKAGISVRHFQDIEACRRAGVRLATVERIAKVLHVQVWELLQPGRYPEPQRQRGRSVGKIKR
jgi:transcriptional regulator with XRE-family HTH domain